MSSAAYCGGMTEGVFPILSAHSKGEHLFSWLSGLPQKSHGEFCGKRKAPPRLRPRRRLYKEWRGRKGIRPSEDAPRGWEAPAANADAGGAAARDRKSTRLNSSHV